jgi:Methane oxygenase PmoA
VLDFDITIKATAGPVTFGDTKEGMFGLRVASSMDVTRKPGGRITNAEGLTDAAAWGQPSAWVDYTGPLAGRTVGIAILNHPDSFRYPTTWHVRDYGLFAANPFGWHDFGMKTGGDHTIPAGQSITFRYRVILHEGKTDPANLTAAFQGYARPPKIEIQE